MAGLGENVLPEGSSITKPPGFNGEHYSFWKLKMKIFIKANGYKLWRIIERGDIVPVRMENDIAIPKSPEEYTNEDIENVELNSKAILMIQSALSQKEYFRISNLSTAKQMWDALEVAHEGTAGVKGRRINLLTTEYHLFKMKEDESIRELEIRFTHIINNLAALGKFISQEEQVIKILSILTDKWQAKATAIEEIQGESMSSVTSLFGSLAEHESKIKYRQELAGDDKKKKTLALTVSNREIDDEEEEDLDDEEVALMVRRFRRFFKGGTGRRNQKGGTNYVKKDQQRGPPVCYECKKPGHFKSECPSLQRLKDREGKRDKYTGKKKAYVSSIWGDSSDEEGSEPEETANLCLVAREEESDIEVTTSDSSCHELQDAYNDLHIEFVKMAKEIVLLRKRNKEFEKEKVAEISKCENCEKLTLEKEKLSKTLQTFTKGSEMLDIILTNQKAYRDRTGLGYDTAPSCKTEKRKAVKRKPYLQFFRKASEHVSPFSFCNFCNKKGHSISTCHPRKYGVTANYKWVPKGTLPHQIQKDYKLSANPKGPKQVWVPKIS